MRRIAAGLVGLGLIGGAGAVAYDDSGTPTVTISDHGKKRQVTLATAGGQSYSCPPGTQDKLAPHDVRAGRITLTLQRVRRQERKLEKRYPDHRAPKAIVARYNALVDRDNRLVDSYNEAVGKSNAILRAECTAE